MKKRNIKPRPRQAKKTGFQRRLEFYQRRDAERKAEGDRIIRDAERLLGMAQEAGQAE